MSAICIRAQTISGNTISDTLYDLIKLSTRTNTMVACDVNDIEVIVKPLTVFEDLMMAYQNAYNNGDIVVTAVHL